MTASTTPRATRREWIGLAVLALPCAIYAMDLTVLNLAVPQISQDLQPSSTQLLWILDIYGFLVAGCLITMGTLGDRIGRRRLLMIGAAAFAAASVVAAFSTSADMLIATRALLGVAGATVAPSTLSLIRNMFLDPGQRTIAISVWVTSYSVGAAIGPPLGGVLLEFFWWGSVFLLAVPVMVLLLVLGPVLLPEYRDRRAGKPDLLSAALSLAGVLSVIYGVKQIAEHGLGSLPVLCILAGLAMGAVFLHRQGKLPDPLIDLGLFRARAFSVSLLTYMLGAVVAFGSFVFIAQYLQLVLGLSPLQAGLWTMPFALAFIVGSMLTPLLVRLARPGTVMACGLIVAAVGFALLSRVSSTSGLEQLIPGFVIFSLGLAPVFTLATDLVVGTAPPERAGAASAISETCAEFGGALGIAILGSIGAAIYRREMASAIPEGLSAEAADAARSTLGGAVVAAQSLGEGQAVELLASARAAFSQSLELTALVSVVLVMASAVLVLAVLRNVNAAREPVEVPPRPREPDLAVAAVVSPENERD